MKLERDRDSCRQKEETVPQGLEVQGADMAANTLFARVSAVQRGQLIPCCQCSGHSAQADGALQNEPPKHLGDGVGTMGAGSNGVEQQSFVGVVNISFAEK